MSQSVVEVAKQLDTAVDRRNSAESFMEPVVAVAVQPIGRHVTCLPQVVDHVVVTYLSAVGLAEPFDMGAIREITSLDALQTNAVALSPFHQGVCDELGAVVQSNRRWLSATASIS